MVATPKALATKYGRDGVLVNSVLPGYVRTEMQERGADEVGEVTGETREEVIAREAEAVPAGRYGSPEEAAALIVFLCSNAASYVNGSAIDIDGGIGGHI